MRKYIIANWKSNKNPKEAIEWINIVTAKTPSDIFNYFEVIICAPTVDLPILFDKVNNSFPLKLGAQDISVFPEGSYTGEVSASLISGLAAYVLLGHSERRKLFHETDETIVKKSILALAQGLIPIICISNEDEIVQWKNYAKDKISPKDHPRIIFSYEPLSAISTGEIGRPEDPQKADEFINEIKFKNQITTCIYGGSVNPENISSLIDKDHIDGVLVGSTSLNPEKFLEVLENALPR